SKVDHRALNVQSRHVVERIESESFGLFCPELTNPLEGRQASKALEAFREVVRVKEHGQMRAKTGVRVVVEPPDRGVFDGSVHPPDLAVRPRVVEFREAMLDAELSASQVKGVRSEGPPVGEQLLNLLDVPAALRRRELKPVIREHRVNAVGHAFHKAPQE